MFPGTTIDRVRDRWGRDSIAFGQDSHFCGGIHRSFLADLAYRLLSKFRQMLGFPMGPFTSTLLYFVVGVVLVIPNEQMGRSDAGPIVTVVQNELAFGDGSIFEFPGNSMGSERCKFESTFFGGAADYAITTCGIQKSSPYPTATFDMIDLGSVFVYTFPKPDFAWLPETASGFTHGSSC